MPLPLNTALGCHHASRHPGMNHLEPYRRTVFQMLGTDGVDFIYAEGKTRREAAAAVGRAVGPCRIHTLF
jgi:FMN-dependent NADH-azoreductase